MPICTTFFSLLGFLSWLTALALRAQAVSLWLLVMLALSAAFHQTVLHSWSAAEVNNILRKSNLYLVREHAEMQWRGFASRTLQEEWNRNKHVILSSWFLFQKSVHFKEVVKPGIVWWDAVTTDEIKIYLSTNKQISRLLLCFSSKRHKIILKTNLKLCPSSLRIQWMLKNRKWGKGGRRMYCTCTFVHPFQLVLVCTDQEMSQDSVCSCPLLVF